MRIEYSEVPIKDVIKYFMGSFKMNPDNDIVDYKWFYDSAKQIIVFKYFIGDEVDEKYEAMRADLIK